MSGSMPIVANTAAASPNREASNTEGNATDVESTDSSGGFPKLLKAQLHSTKSGSDSDPASDPDSTPDPKPDPGKDSPPDMASPAQAAMIPLEIFQVHNNAATSLSAPGQTTTVNPLTASNTGINTTGANTGNEVNGLAPNANADDPLDVDETLMTRQQQQLIQAVTNSKDGPQFSSLLKQQGGTEVASPPPLPASSVHNNALNLAAGLPAGPIIKADAVPGQSPPALNVPLQHPGWNQAMGDRLQWMVGHHLQSANIRLDPPELGRLDVHIQLHKDHASIAFAAPNQQVRDALESAVPRLREMMNNIGLSLGDVNVSQESFSQGQQANENARSANMFDHDDTEDDRLKAIAPIGPIAPRRGIGMLDAYA